MKTQNKAEIWENKPACETQFIGGTSVARIKKLKTNESLEIIYSMTCKKFRSKI